MEVNIFQIVSEGKHNTTAVLTNTTVFEGLINTEYHI